jgi:hypothetical protein
VNKPRNEQGSLLVLEGMRYVEHFWMKFVTNFVDVSLSPSNSLIGWILRSSWIKKVRTTEKKCLLMVHSCAVSSGSFCLRENCEEVFWTVVWWWLGAVAK